MGGEEKNPEAMLARSGAIGTAVKTANHLSLCEMHWPVGIKTGGEIYFLILSFHCGYDMLSRKRFYFFRFMLSLSGTSIEMFF